ncbi:MAG: hypothetical protein AAGI07_09425 [Bacteroidota bacterium]
MKNLTWIQSIFLFTTFSLLFFSCDDDGDDNDVSPAPSISLNSSIPTEANFDEGITISANIIARANLESIVLSRRGNPTPLITKENGFTNSDSDQFSFTYTSNLEDVGDTIIFDLEVTDRRSRTASEAIEVKISDAEIGIAFLESGTTNELSDSIGTVNDNLTFDVKISSNIGLTSVTIEQFENGSTAPVSIDNIDTFDDEKALTYNFNQTLSGEYYLVTATDKSDFTTSRRYWVSMPLDFLDLTLGAQQSQTGSFLSFNANNQLVTVTQAEATQAQEDVVMLYYVDETDGVTFTAPNDSSENNFFANVITDWTTRNETLFKKATDQSVYDAGLNYLQVVRAYNNDEAEESLKISGFTANDVIFAKTTTEGDVTSEQVLMIKITEVSTDANGTVIIRAQFEGTAGENPGIILPNE